MSVNSSPCDRHSRLPALLDRLARLRVRLTVHDGRVTADAPKGAVTGGLRQELAAQRDDLRRIVRGEVDIDDEATPLDVQIVAWRSKPDVRQFLETLDRRYRARASGPGGECN